jgi:hypothetical protein
VGRAAGVGVGPAVAGAAEASGVSAAGVRPAVACEVADARPVDGNAETVGLDSQAAIVAIAEMARNRRRVSAGIDSTGSP